MSVRIFIPDDVIVDEEVPEPRAGAHIPAMGVRLGSGRSFDDLDDSLDGIVEWSRADELNGLVEAVVATASFRVLTQDVPKQHRADVGDHVTLRGTLSCVRSYEFDAFQLPDFRQPWRVIALLSRDRDGYLIEAEPVPA